MTDETSNLILEHLRHIRAKVDLVSLDVDDDDVKLRMSMLEQHAGNILTICASISSNPEPQLPNG